MHPQDLHLLRTLAEIHTACMVSPSEYLIASPGIKTQLRITVACWIGGYTYHYFYIFLNSVKSNLVTNSQQGSNSIRETHTSTLPLAIQNEMICALLLDLYNIQYVYSNDEEPGNETSYEQKLLMSPSQGLGKAQIRKPIARWLVSILIKHPSQGQARLEYWCSFSVAS